MRARLQTQTARLPWQTVSNAGCIGYKHTRMLRHRQCLTLTAAADGAPLLWCEPVSSERRDRVVWQLRIAQQLPSGRYVAVCSGASRRSVRCPRQLCRCCACTRQYSVTRTLAGIEQLLHTKAWPRGLHAWVPSTPPGPVGLKPRRIGNRMKNCTHPVRLVRQHAAPQPAARPRGPRALQGGCCPTPARR